MHVNHYVPTNSLNAELVDSSARAIRTQTFHNSVPHEQQRPLPAHFYCLCTTRAQNCNAEFCDTILTYKDPDNRNGSMVYDLPNSTWTTARNDMYILAKRRRRTAKLKGIQPESHYCFMDGDVKINNVAKQELIEQLGNETELRKIIAFNYRNAFRGVRYMYYTDAHLNCFAEASMDQYLPFATWQDSQAWALSQQDMIMRANLIEPFVFKLYDNVITRNPSHNNAYPRSWELGSIQLIGRQIEEGFSPGCFPKGAEDPVRQAADNHACSFQGRELFNLSFNRTYRFK